MKKRTKEILSGVLALSILLGTPAGMESAEATGRKRADKGCMEVCQTDLRSTETLTEAAIETAMESAIESAIETKIETSTEAPTETAIENSMENPIEISTETLTEISAETSTKDTSKNQSEILSELFSEVVSEDTSKNNSEQTSTADSEWMPEETTEIAEIEEDMEEEWVEIPMSCFLPEISDDGELDYRTYVDQGDDLLITVKKSETEQDRSLRIKVKNSALYDSDFYIELSGDGQVQQYEYAEWVKYLESRHGWVDGTTEVKLSDTGKKYYDSIQMEEQQSEAGDGKKNYTFWAVNSDKNVSTKDVENGTRAYTAGRDVEAPVLKAFCADSECYEPTKMDTEQYFAKDFVMKGTFGDDLSGVCRIEYTTDIRSEGEPVWIPIEIPMENTQESAGSIMDFQIALQDGCYPAIAVRAVDEAGNVSGASSLVNDAGESIKVVVDSAAPVLTFDVSAGGQPYSGEKDNWTNKDVRIVVTPDPGSCSYAGIARYEYACVKVGEDVTDVTDASEKWTELKMRDESSAGLELTEDVNGYYLFRAVSKSGIKTDENATLRILIQHQAAEIKPILVSGADETKCKDGWYNKQSGTPKIRFEYPEYDTGVTSGEYDAPITIHYQLTRKDFVPDTTESDAFDEASGTVEMEKSAVIGVMNCEDMTINTDVNADGTIAGNASGMKEFVLTRDGLDQHIVDFGDRDGFYTLYYWTTDKAGNESEKQITHYKVDCHEPTDLTMELAGSAFEIGKESAITYERSYRDTVSGSAQAQYGISGKGSLVIEKVKRIGEWNDRDNDHSETQDNVSIVPNTRCFLYVRAEDAAGNVAEGWTDGIVVDNMAPNESADGNHRELIVEPEGANEHGFFNDDITIDIQIKDAPEDDNCAALQLVTSSIGRDGTDTITGQELFSFTKSAPTEKELIEASDFHGTQLIDARANESNEAYIEVTATDRSGNTKTSMHPLKIDVTRPEIDISFDHEDAVNGIYYRQGRTVTIHVHELNFNPDAVSVLVTKDDETSEMILSEWKHDQSEHYATFALMEDGMYSIAASCVDLADNASDEIQSETFIIDCTAPEMTIGLTAGPETLAADREYFNTAVTAVITVTEHNFRTEDFMVNRTPVSEGGTWSHEGDTHILQIPFEGDNIYHIDCAYTDMAGNFAKTVERDFTIDTEAPVIVIDGIEDGSANSGAILPVISVRDLNLEMSDISVSVVTGIGDEVENVIATSYINDKSGTGYRMTLTDLTDKPDNIYYLSVSVCDKAENVSALTYRFSLNRTGSVYDLTSLLNLMERHYNTYDALRDIQIVEMNIDIVDEFEIYVSRNGKLGYEAKYTKEMSGSADSGYTYVYNISKENFSTEGIYRLTLYSRDRAGNEVNNATSVHGKEITFIVDNTAPKVIIDGVESGMLYDVEAQEVHVVVMDNFQLSEAGFTLVNKAGEVLGYWDYMELAKENEPLSITIPQHNETVSLLYRVKDAAGNELQTFQGDRAARSDFLVTTDKQVQFLYKPSQTSKGRFIILVTGVSGMTLLLVIILLIKGKCRLKNK